MSTTTTHDDVLAAIRDELAAIKVPGAESAEPRDAPGATSTSTRSTSSRSSRRSRIAYDVQIADAAEGIASVGDAVALVRSRRRARGRPRVTLDGDVVVTGRGVVSLDRRGRRRVLRRAAGASGRGSRTALGAVHGVRPRAGDDAEGGPARRPLHAARGRRGGAGARARPGWPATASSPSALGVIVGTGVGGLDDARGASARPGWRAATAPSPRYFVPMMMPNAAAGTIAMRLGAHGPGFCVASACATGSHAIGEALRIIQRGEADVVVAGGTEAALTGLCLAAFKRMGALSREGVSRPFDAQRDGFVMGEGAGVLVLERAEHARARGATVYGRIAGYGASNDAFHITQPDEDGPRRAAGDAGGAGRRGRGARPTSATSTRTARGTPYNDKIETHAVHSGLQRRARRRPSARRSRPSATCSARPARSRRSRLLEALRRGVLPPTLNYDEPDPECDLDYVPEGPREAPGLELALSNSFGVRRPERVPAVARA